MKILHANFSFTQGGIDNMMIDIMSGEVERGNDVWLMIINKKIDPMMMNMIPSKIRIINIGRPPGSIAPFYIIKIWIFLLKISPDIIHCHNSAIATLIPFSKVPRILTVHDIGYSTQHYGKYDCVAAISESVYHDIRKTYIGNNLCVIHNGIQFNTIKRNTQKTPSLIKKIVIVGRLVFPKKGHDLLIKALKELSDEGINNWCLDVIGGGESETYLKKIAMWPSSYKPHIRWLGVKDRNWIYDNLCNYDLLVLPSRYEGFGLTIVEAVAAGVTVLSSNIDGPKEILSEGKYGYLFESENVNSLKESIKNILSMDYGRLSEINKKAYYALKEEYSINNTISKYLLCYNRLIKR